MSNPFDHLSILRSRAWHWPTIALVLVIKMLLFVFAVQAFTTASADWYGSWMSIWNRWDASHYLALAERGYSSVGDDRVRLAFFPLYPWLVRAASWITRDVLAAALLVSGVASVAAALLLRKLARLDQSDEIANESVWFLLIFPTSYFLHIPYTEALFLALVLGSFVSARSGRWEIAGVVGACACLTRVNGLMLVPALAFEAFSQYRATRKIYQRWLWIGFIPLGFAIYLWLNYQITGDPFAFLKIQHENWFKALTPPWTGIADVWLRVLGENPMEGLHEFVFIVLGFVFTAWCWCSLRPSYSVWMTCNLLLITSTSFVLSVPRFLLTFFPIFILCARLCVRRQVLAGGLSVCCLLFYALYAGRFVRGLWAF